MEQFLKLAVRGLVAIIALVGLFRLIKYFFDTATDRILYKDQLTKGPQGKSELDELIEQKKRTLIEQGLAPKPGASKTSPGPLLNFVEQFYSQKLQELKSKGLEKELPYQEIKKILTLLGQVQWGEGGQFRELAEKLSTLIGLPIDPHTVVRSTSGLLKSEALKDTLQNGPTLLYNDFVLLISGKFFLEKLFAESRLREGELLLTLHKTHGIPTWIYAQAAYLLANERLNGDIKKLIISLARAGQHYPLFSEENSQSMAHEALWNILLKNPSGTPSVEQLLERLKEHAEVLDGLKKPRTDLNTKTFKANPQLAYQHLGCSESDDFETLKKQFQKMAQKKHPDRFASLGLPADLIQRASENFALMKEAYECLKETHGQA